VTESAAHSQRAPAPDGAASARVQLLGRQGCHLCDVAREVVATVTAAAGETFVEVDIDDDPALRERYTDLVPVVLIDGVEHAHWRVDAGQLRAALS
jgi:glutaredoxin